MAWPGASVVAGFEDRVFREADGASEQLGNAESSTARKINWPAPLATRFPMIRTRLSPATETTATPSTTTPSRAQHARVRSLVSH